MFPLLTVVNLLFPHPVYRLDRKASGHFTEKRSHFHCGQSGDFMAEALR